MAVNRIRFVLAFLAVATSVIFIAACNNSDPVQEYESELALELSLLTELANIRPEITLDSSITRFDTSEGSQYRAYVENFSLRLDRTIGQFEAIEPPSQCVEFHVRATELLGIVKQAMSELQAAFRVAEQGDRQQAQNMVDRVIEQTSFRGIQLEIALRDSEILKCADLPRMFT